MALPFFYIHSISNNNSPIVLDEDTSKHITQVLRKKVGEEILLTDGKGTKAKAVITGDHRKRCEVKVLSTESAKAPAPQITVAISLVKNTARFEWFLEKATEIGINHIIPLLCERTEKEKFRQDRLEGILISAMLQSQQSWLPYLSAPTEFLTVVKEASAHQKFIAHCLPEQKMDLTKNLKKESSIILIGPEGDFSPAEIEVAIKEGFAPVTLGDTRLRTETAGMVASVLLRNAFVV